MRNVRQLRHHLAAAATVVAVTSGVSASATSFVVNSHACKNPREEFLLVCRHATSNKLDWGTLKKRAVATLTSCTYSRSIGRTTLEALPTKSKLASAKRTYQTAADQYFHKYKCIPRPSVMHAILPISQQSLSTDKTSEKEPFGILVVGDVHGCFDELMLLEEKAVSLNKGRPFQYVIFVGDLVNKGPKSLQVVRYARKQPNWFSVRGNHDDGALAAALGDERRRNQPKYQWIFGGMDDEDCLSDADIQWLVELPYTLRIPHQALGTSVDTIIVHAGFVPGVELQKQEIDNMINLRTVKPATGDGTSSGDTTWAASSSKDGQPWASIYSGPEHVIFGHDARRGLQLQAFATGLDTGACYGKQLTGIILPSNELVAVDSLAEHSQIG